MIREAGTPACRAQSSARSAHDNPPAIGLKFFPTIPRLPDRAGISANTFADDISNLLPGSSIPIQRTTRIRPVLDLRARRRPDRLSVVPHISHVPRPLSPLLPTPDVHHRHPQIARFPYPGTAVANKDAR